MFDPAKDPGKVVDALDALNIDLEVAKHFLNSLKHLDDSAESAEEWHEIRRGVMLMVNSVDRQIDSCREVVRTML